MPKKKTKKSNINSNGELKISKMLSKNVANKTKEIDEDRSVKGKDDRSRSSDRALQKKTKARKAEQTDKCLDEVKIKRNAKLPPLPNRIPKQSSTPATIKTESNVGCFGFMSTWIRKRKEKRRQKKREAIKARETNSTCMVTKLNRCERGGVAFTVEFENRVMKKPVLPPIKSKSESVNIDHEGKMYKAEKNRQEQLQKKMRFVQEKEKKRIENAGRKIRQAELNGTEVERQNVSPRPASHVVLSCDHPDYDDDADIISPFFSNQHIH